MARQIHWIESTFLNSAIRQIKVDYGDDVAPKAKSLLKFGANDSVGTSEATVMQFLGSETSETYVSTNAIDKISSSSNSDTVTMRLEGHTISGGVFTFVVQDVTLTGQTKATLSTPLARVTRAYNTGSSNLVGTIYVYEDDATTTPGVPDTASKVHIIAAPAENQSLKAATTLSNVDYALITKVYASVNKKTAGGAVIRLKIRNVGGVFRTIYKRGINSNGPDLDFDTEPFLIVPKNADVILTAEADQASTPVSAGFNSILCKVV